MVGFTAGPSGAWFNSLNGTFIAAHQVLEEEILPALEKLRKERGSYMQWVSASDQLDRLRRFCIAYEFANAEKVQGSAGDSQAALQDTMTALTDKVADTEAKVRSSLGIAPSNSGVEITR